MSKAAQINNDLWLKEMMTNPQSNPQFENFYKEELVRFCKIAKKDLTIKTKMLADIKSFIEVCCNYEYFYKIDGKYLKSEIKENIFEIMGIKYELENKNE